MPKPKDSIYPMLDRVLLDLWQTAEANLQELPAGQDWHWEQNCVQFTDIMPVVRGRHKEKPFDIYDINPPGTDMPVDVGASPERSWLIARTRAGDTGAAPSVALLGVVTERRTYSGRYCWLAGKLYGVTFIHNVFGVDCRPCQNET